MGKKSKEFVVGYNYFLGMHTVACMAPVDGMVELTFDDRTAWTGSAGSSITVNAPGLFGGKEREGGVAGYVDYLGGGPTQGANGYLKQVLSGGSFTDVDTIEYGEETFNPGLVSAFRGTAGLVFRRFYWGNNPYIKRMRQKWMNVLSTHPRQLEGYQVDPFFEYVEEQQWYPEWAPICQEFNTKDQIVYLALDNSGSMVGVKDQNMRAAIKEFVANLAGTSGAALAIQPWSVFQTHPAFERIPFGPDDVADAQAYIDSIPNPDLGTDFNAGVGGSKDFFDRAELALLGQESYQDYEPALDGSALTRVEDIGVISSLQRIIVFLSDGNHNTNDIQDAVNSVAAGGGFCYAFGIGSIADLDLIDNTGTDGVPLMNFDGSNLLPFITGPFRSWSDLNAAHILRDVLVSPTSGGSGDSSEIGDSFVAAAETLYNEGMGFSFFWRNPGDRDSFKKLVEQHANCVSFRSRFTGKWEIKLIRADYDSADLFVVDDSIITEWLSWEKPEWREVPNHITMEYTRRDNGEVASISQSNPAGVQITGRINPDTVTMEGVTCPALAPKILQRELQSRTQPWGSGEIRCAYLPPQLDLGSEFIVNEPKLGIDNRVMRITEIEETDGRDNSIVVRFSEDVFQDVIANVAVVDDQAFDGSGNGVAQPSDILFHEEMAYYDLVFGFGQSETDTDLVDDVDLGRWQMTGDAFDTQHSIGILVRQASPDQPWSDVGQAVLMPVWTLLGELPRDPSVTQFTVMSNGREFEVIAGGILQVGVERMRVDSITIDPATFVATFTVGRGVLDTVPWPHVIGDPVFYWEGFAGTDRLDYTAGESVTVKILPKLRGDTVDINDANPSTVYFDSRAIRPYPVGNLQVDGSYAPYSVLSGVVTVTWAHRDRLIQTSEVIQDHTAGDIGPEAGISYHLVRRWVDFTNGQEVVSYTTEGAISPPDATSVSVDLDDAAFLTYQTANAVRMEIGILSRRSGYENWQTPFVEVAVGGLAPFNLQGAFNGVPSGWTPPPAPSSPYASSPSVITPEPEFFRGEATLSQTITIGIDNEIVIASETFDTANAFSGNRFTVTAGLNGRFAEFFAALDFSSLLGRRYQISIERSTDAGSTWSVVAANDLYEQSECSVASGPVLLQTGHIYRATQTSSWTTTNNTSDRQFFSGVVL